MEKRISYKAKKVIKISLCNMFANHKEEYGFKSVSTQNKYSVALCKENTLFSLTLYIPWCLKTRFELTSVAITSQHGTAH